ncbi:hypothetical protein K1719_030410 [Acacia pycnantha]|nr:hypothetical protein K1719_030410 [Acacia pycnantha]
MSESSSSPQWNFYQIFGHRPIADELPEDDIITAIQFEKRGDYLATGDQGGRVAIFERYDRNTEPLYRRNFLEELDSAPAQRPKFRFKSEFQSHKPEVDYFTNAVVTERIKKVSWCVAQNGLLLLLSANNKKIKLWTIKERRAEKSEQVFPHEPHRFLSSENVLMSQRSIVNGQETLSQEDPTFQDIDVDDEIADTGNNLHAKCRRTFGQDHIFYINSISNNSDAQTFISSDTFRINLSNLEVGDRSFNLIDMKPPNMQYALEMITSAEFHPVHCNLLTYGSSLGLIRISDMRQALRCDRSAKVFLDRSLFGMKPPLEEMTGCISDVKFQADDGIGGQQLISRDYLNMKLWDMRMDSRPVVTFRIHENLRPRLAELYTEAHIFDKFDCCFSRDGRSFATGSYSNRLKIFSTVNRCVEDIKLDIIESVDNFRMPVLPKRRVSRSPILSHMKPESDQGEDLIEDDLDFNLNSKLLRVAWHPTYNLVAGAAQSNLILYHG